ncbi:hypothetical protein BKA62DRAFT_672722 [Auriculariales sp. MPI-PUGE-AT-0066]|nr:hypothetical protein BKA62DRAFT_672722 [Auriculariales sp. MPI-PUGE-AT-0066]
MAYWPTVCLWVIHELVNGTEEVAAWTGCRWLPLGHLQLLDNSCGPTTAMPLQVQHQTGSFDRFAQRDPVVVECIKFPPSFRPICAIVETLKMSRFGPNKCPTRGTQHIRAKPAGSSIFAELGLTPFARVISRIDDKAMVKIWSHIKKRATGRNSALNDSSKVWDQILQRQVTDDGIQISVVRIGSVQSQSSLVGDRG